MTNFEKVREFHEAFGLDNNVKPTVLDPKLLLLRMDLIYEEVGELDYELFQDKTEFDKAAKELADILYVTYGTAAVLGIDLDKAFDAVHKSNMSKLGPDGKPIYREDGKVLKGPNYQPPDMSAFTA